MLDRICRNAAVSACAFVLATATACSSGKSEPPGASESATGKSVKLTEIDDETCELIFDQKALAEIRDNPRTRRVNIPREAPRLQAAAARMDSEMTTFDPDMVGCYIADKAKRELISLTVNWGQKTFPVNAREAGRATSYSVSEKPAPLRWLQLQVDCQRSDLMREGRSKRKLPVELILKDHVDLSNRSRASLLNSAAKVVTNRLSCSNEPTYPDPTSVVFQK